MFYVALNVACPWKPSLFIVLGGFHGCPPLRFSLFLPSPSLIFIIILRTTLTPNLSSVDWYPSPINYPSPSPNSKNTPLLCFQFLLNSPYILVNFFWVKNQIFFLFFIIILLDPFGFFFFFVYAYSDMHTSTVQHIISEERRWGM